MKKYYNKIVCMLLALTMLFGTAATANVTSYAGVFGADIVEYARQYIGYPYVYATHGPDSFDCSGFVYYVFKHFGISLPLSSSYYWNNPDEYGTVVGYNSFDKAQAGDVISWNGHVAIYTENGYVVQAGNTKDGVHEKYKISSMKSMGDYRVIRIYGVQTYIQIDGIPFLDLGGYESYAEYVKYTSVYNAFIAGTDPPKYTRFSPQVSITRAMLISILYRMANNPYDNGNNPHHETPFSDITNTNAYYYNAACWALDKGITNQICFKPDEPVTREQTARFLFNYASENGKVDSNYKNVDLNSYPDIDEVHEWAKEPLQWAKYNNMITGTQQGYINPLGSTQRIHAARILYGFGKVCSIGNFK